MGRLTISTVPSSRKAKGKLTPSLGRKHREMATPQDSQGHPLDLDMALTLGGLLKSTARRFGMATHLNLMLLNGKTSFNSLRLVNIQ